MGVTEGNFSKEIKEFTPEQAQYKSLMLEELRIAMEMMLRNRELDLREKELNILEKQIEMNERADVNAVK